MGLLGIDRKVEKLIDEEKFAETLVARIEKMILKILNEYKIVQSLEKK